VLDATDEGGTITLAGNATVSLNLAKTSLSEGDFIL
jgi:hypothetical protein